MKACRYRAAREAKRRFEERREVEREGKTMPEIDEDDADGLATFLVTAVLATAVRQTKSNDEALELVVRKLAEMSDEIKRAALAFAAFGEEGCAMARITQDGVVALEAMRAAARETGLAFNEYLVAEGERVHDELERLGVQIEKNLKESLIGLGPVLI